MSHLNPRGMLTRSLRISSIRRPSRVRLVVETLEPRVVLSSFTVTDNSDSALDTGSLRNAILQADASTDPTNTITIDSTLAGGQTITLTAPLPQIKGNVTINGPGASVVSVSGNQAYQVFNIASGASVTISGLTITQGLAPSQVSNSTLLQQTQAAGGGIDNAGTLTLTNSIVTGNDATVALSAPGGGSNTPLYYTGYARGAGIQNEATGTLTIVDSTISGNTASAVITATGAQSTLKTRAVGAGLYNLGSLTLQGSTISGNQATSTILAQTTNDTKYQLAYASGAGFTNGSAAASATVSDSTIAGNTASGSVSVTSGAGAGASAKVNGGGINNAGTLIVSSSAITGNTASATASNILSSSSTVHFAPSYTYVNGGGIYNGPAGQATITDSTIAGNLASANAQGGSASGAGGVSSNARGGGIALGGPATLISSTISGNSAAATASSPGGDVTYSRGGGIYSSYSDSNGFTIGDTIVSGNTATNGPDVWSSVYPAVSLGHNLIGVADGASGWVATDLTGNTASPLNAQLGPLANNGGPTQTIGLLPGSPAINAGSNSLAVDANNQPLSFDQRGVGFTRIVGGSVDIGAYEVQAVTSNTSTTTVSPSAPSTIYGQPVTFTATVTSNGSPETQGTVTFVDGTTVLVSNVPVNASGQAVFTTSALQVTTNAHNISAQYQGPGGASSGSTSETITPAPLTVLVNVGSKTYDGTTSARFLGGTLEDVIGTDQVSLTGGTATFGDKNAGDGKLVTVTGLGLGGPNAADYSLNPTATTTSSIFPLAISDTITASDKVYDSTTSATIASETLNGVLGSDQVTLTGGTATFADKNVGTDKTVNVTGLSLVGADAGNYSISLTATTTASITPLAITGSVTASDKVYDGTTAATIASESLSGVLGSDVVSLTVGGATFSDKNVGTNKVVTATGLALNGADAGNYTVNSTATATASITPLAITGSITAEDKVYDGTTTATITSGSLSGVLGSDVVSLTGGTATFADKNVGTDKPVTATGLTLTGADAANYTVNSTATTTANITPAPLTVTAVGQNKVYDGTTAATVSLSDNRIAGDVLTVTYASAAFTDPNAGTGKTINVSGIALTGTDAGNYTVNGTATTTADIAKADQTITWANPADISSGVALSSTQLNATVTGVAGGSAPGALTYSPPAGTILPAGMNQALTVTAAATANYNAATLTVHINVLSASQQDAALIQQVASLVSSGVLTSGQGKSLTAKLNLKGNAGDLVRVAAFIVQVDTLALRGILTVAQAISLDQGATRLFSALLS